MGQSAGVRAVLAFEVAVQVGGIHRAGRFRSKDPSVDLVHVSGPDRAARVWFEPERGLLIEPRS